jgi:hypothetical protein
MIGNYKMNFNWKIKSICFFIIDLLKLYKVLYFIQKHITKRSKVCISKKDFNWEKHEKNLKQIKGGEILEFGAGKSLSQNIYLSKFFKSQVVVDLFPMLDIEMFNKAAKSISQLEAEIDFKQSNNLDDVKKNYNIIYIAPFDISKTSFLEGSFDGCISTNTLEHIPMESIVKIFAELKRIVCNKGLISLIIDYSDHYAHTDSKIGLLNFLKYSDSEFNKYNHSIHYQNRLRHYDYAKLFKELGYLIAVNKPYGFVDIPNYVSSKFNLDDATLRATKGYFLLEVKK